MSRTASHISAPYKVCACGHVYATKLALFEESVPVGLQHTDTYASTDYELRTCPACGSTFALPFPKLTFAH